MVTELMKYEFQGNAVRVVVRDGEPWWVAKDVCDVLGLGNPSMAVTRLDGDEVNSTEVIDSVGRVQTANTVNEAGLYSLILGSRKPEAKVLKRWVTHDVLPDIRKHGMYATDTTRIRARTRKYRGRVRKNRCIRAHGTTGSADRPGHRGDELDKKQTSWGTRQHFPRNCYGPREMRTRTFHLAEKDTA